MAPAQTTAAPSSSPEPVRTDGSLTRLLWARRRALVEVLVLVLLATVAVSLVRHHVAQVYSIPSGSMQPLLEPGDRVVVTRLDEQVQRGDVVVFDGSDLFAFGAPASPGRVAVDTVGGWLGVPAGEHDFVKRVIGVGGDRVVCCDAQGRLTVNGAALDEPYVMPGDEPSETAFDVEVPAGRLWVMGDHRSDSADSRSHLGDPGGGMVPLDRVVGRVVAIAWPPGQASTIGRADSDPAAGTNEGNP